MKENIQRSKTLAVALAFGVSAADNKLNDCEIELIKNWSRENINLSETSGKERRKLEKALKETGLKDDDGKEIYEGDICEIVYHITHGPHEKCKAEVFWDKEIGGYLFDRDHQFNRIELTKCKVIGHIHENSKTSN